MPALFTNDALSTINGAISDSATTIVLSTNANLFPSPTGDDYAYLTLFDFDGNKEIVKLTARSGTSCTVVREQEGTTAVAWPDGSWIELRVTAAGLNSKADIGGATPVGQVALFAMDGAPTGWLKANGAAISRTTYAMLFSAIGTTFGAGDGSTTFNVPDVRGEFFRGWDDSRGVDSGRVFGSSQTDLLKSHTHGPGSGSNFWFDGTGITVAGGGGAYNFNNTTTTAAFGGSETRPRNIALLACIKY